MWPDNLANMSDEEFAQWYSSLTPQQQQMFNYQQQYAGVNTPTPAFGQYSPEVSPAGFDIGQLVGPNPDVDAKGNVEPWDLSNQAQAMNYTQDYGQSLDSIMAMILGGQGSYDPSLFDPITTYSGPQVSTATPGKDEVTQLAQMGGGGWTSMLAEQIAAGTDPSTAVGFLMDQINKAAQDPKLAEDPDVKALLMSLPTKVVTPAETLGMTPQQKAVTQYDTEALLPFAMDLAKKVAADPTSFTGYQDPTSGLLYQNAPTTTYSKTAQQFRDAGLPMPTESYTDPSRINSIAPVDYEGWAKAKAADDSRRSQLQSNATTATSNYDKLAAEYDKWQKEVAAYVPPVAGGGGGAGARGPDISPSGAGAGALTPGSGQGGGAGARTAPEQGTSVYGQELFPGWAQGKEDAGNAFNAAAGVAGDAAHRATQRMVGLGGQLNDNPLTRYKNLAETGGNLLHQLVFGGGDGGDDTQTMPFSTPHGPLAPTVHMQNGQWVVGPIGSGGPQANFSQASMLANPEATGAPLDAGKLAQAKTASDQARRAAAVGGRMGTYGEGANKRFLTRAAGVDDQIRAVVQANAMQQQGRSPLTDAYMQRMMGMRSLGFG